MDHQLFAAFEFEKEMLVFEISCALFQTYKATDMMDEVSGKHISKETEKKAVKRLKRNEGRPNPIIISLI